MASSSEGEKKHSIDKYKVFRLINCGLASGMFQAFIFNPWDRALYLSIKNEKPFLLVENFHHPFQGVQQTIVQRAISAGLYFPMEDIFFELISKKDTQGHPKRDPVRTMIAGTLAGTLNGIFMNPFTRIKYHYWGKVEPGHENFWSTAKEILKYGGVRHLFVGTGATVQRDLIFGGTFALLRHEVLPFFKSSSSGTTVGVKKDKQTDFSVNMISAIFATILSSPVNYVRNIHYATLPSERPKPGLQILRELLADARKESALFDQIRFILVRLRIGWGTARVGCGMAVGAKIYELCSQATSGITSGNVS